MADPATMAMAGAAVGALSNKDDPMKGALMGAALGGGGGYLAGMAAPAGEAALAGTAGETLLTPATMSEFAPVGTVSPVVRPDIGAIPVLPDNAYNYGREIIGTSMPSDLSWMDTISPSQAQAAAPVGSAAKSMMNPYLMQMGLSTMQGAQGQPARMPGQIKQGNPSGLKYDLISSLLEPKMVERRKISLL